LNFEIAISCSIITIFTYTIVHNHSPT
jgi:hypothetical protein